ncbi:MAG: hypothetical protein ACOC2W_01800 [bacterium]
MEINTKKDYLYYIDIMTSAGMMIMSNTKNYEIDRDLYFIMVENMKDLYNNL